MLLQALGPVVTSLVAKNTNYMSTYTGMTYGPPYKQFIHIQVVIHPETFTHNTWWALFALSSAEICVWNCCLSFANLPICLSSSFCSKCTNEFRACTGHTKLFGEWSPIYVNYGLLGWKKCQSHILVWRIFVCKTTTDNSSSQDQFCAEYDCWMEAIQLQAIHI